MKKTAENIWNAANLLTIFRIVMIPVFAAVYRKGYLYASLTVFLAASLTDYLDGQIARKYHMVTNFGKVMDPLADKLMCLTVLFSLASSGTISWTPAILVFAKELFMLLAGACLLAKGIVVQSQMIGKAAQWLMIVSLSLSFFHDFFAGWIMPLDVILLWTAVAVTLLALIYYARNILKTAKKQ